LALPIALVVDQLDVAASAARAWFEQALAGRPGLSCRRVQLDLADGRSVAFTDADCVVVFNRGLHMAGCCPERCGADIPVCPVDQCRQKWLPHLHETGLLTVEIVPAAQGHPVVAGIQPFESRGASEPLEMPQDAKLLLTGRTVGGQFQPLAWTEDGPHGRAFHTALGSSADFGQPDFVRLLLNALAWVGQR
jgi:hypothetical protein